MARELCQHLGTLIRRQSPNCPKRDVYRCEKLNKTTVPMECLDTCSSYEPREKPNYLALILRREYEPTDLNIFDIVEYNVNWSEGWDKLSRIGGICLVVAGKVDPKLFDMEKVQSLFLTYPVVGGNIVRERLTWHYEQPCYWVDVFKNRPLLYQFRSVESWPGQHWPDGGNVNA